MNTYKLVVVWENKSPLLTEKYTTGENTENSDLWQIYDILYLALNTNNPHIM